MSQILCLYEKEPNFPATDQHPSAARYYVGGKVVDALGGAPTQDEIDVLMGVDPASVAVKQAEITRVSGLVSDPARLQLLDQLRTASAAQIDTYVQTNVTDLASAREMLKRVIKVLAVMAR